MPAVENQALFVAAEFARSLSRGTEWFEQFTLEGLGLALPAAVTNRPTVVGALEEIRAAAGNLRTVSDELYAALLSGNAADAIATAVVTADGIRAFVTQLVSLAEVLQDGVSVEVTDGPSRAYALAELDRMPIRVTNVLLAGQLELRTPYTLFALSVLGLADWRWEEVAGSATELHRPYLKQSLHLERLKGLIRDPAQHFVDHLGWGTPGFDPTPFFQIYEELLGEESGAIVGVLPDGHPFLKHGNFQIARAAIDGSLGLQLAFAVDYGEGVDHREHISQEWGVQLDADFAIAGSVGVTVLPPFELELVPPAATAGGALKLLIDRNPSARPWSLVETGGLIGLTVENVAAGTGLAAEVNTSGNLAFEPLAMAGFSDLHLKIGSEEGDSFLAKIIAGAELEATFDLDLEFVPSKGLRVRAAGGVEIMLPIHKDLGPLEIQQFFLGLYIKEDGTLDLETSLALGANLGPLRAVVERMGAKSATKFVEGTQADYGSVATSLGFKPPSGVGLSLDAGVIKGGGYLYIDAERGEYAGALELTFSEWIALKAIALISTRLPDGSQGFSLLIIITVEFGSGIQLGFGFTLIGVGGLLGLNRKTSIEPLAASIRTGAIESVMFPQNVIENAPKIISDLRAFFPTEEGTFLIGPMVKIGWGTPTLLSLSMGIIIELPDPVITILGVIKVVLPTEEAAVLKLQVNFIGRIEFSNQLAWFYAELYDSRVLFITLEGGMGVLVNWGAQSNFVVSVGGFHPDFTPPPLPFPAPPRLAASLLDTSYARVRIEGYFAVTSNSVQFGARAELFFGVSEFKIEGHLGFDALFIFSPFYFTFSISVKLSVKVFGIGLFSVGFSGKLEGPTPWHIKGKGSISLLFFDISVPFEHTWGEEKNTELPAISVLPLLVAELEAVSNWQTELPTGANLLVSLRELGDEEGDRLVLHPIGTLLISQRKVPLAMEMEKFGNQVPGDVRELTVEVGAGLNKLDDRDEQFALGHFKDLSEAEKLSKPAFQTMKGGLKLSAGGAQTRTGSATARSLRYEQIVIDDIHRYPLFVLLEVLTRFIAAYLRIGRRNAVRNSDLSATRKRELAPPGLQITLTPDQFTVVRQADNRPAGSPDTVTFPSQVQAGEYLRQRRKANPAAAAELHVVPATEVNVSE